MGSVLFDASYRFILAVLWLSNPSEHLYASLFVQASFGVEKLTRVLPYF